VEKRAPAGTAGTLEEGNMIDRRRAGFVAALLAGTALVPHAALAQATPPEVTEADAAAADDNDPNVIIVTGTSRNRVALDRSWEVSREDRE
jgi:hypothetical protein